jgi:DNA-binding NarL/FixJ family response regulator
VPARPQKRPRVLLADDHTLILEGLRFVLEPECEVVGTVADGRALLEAAERLQPDVIVADISMPLLNGIDAVKHVKKVKRTIKVVFLTMHADAAYAAKAIEAGGSGYVLKNSAPDELLSAIREALSGRNYVTPALSTIMVDSVNAANSRRELSDDGLTPRQREVLQLVAEGKTLKEIGAILNVSARTVEFHKYRIMEHLGLRTTGELVQYAVRHGLVGSGPALHIP